MDGARTTTVNVRRGCELQQIGHKLAEKVLSFIYRTHDVSRRLSLIIPGGVVSRYQPVKRTSFALLYRVFLAIVHDGSEQIEGVNDVWALRLSHCLYVTIQYLPTI